jgi:hypothetical protein
MVKTCASVAIALAVLASCAVRAEAGPFRARRYYKTGAPVAAQAAAPTYQSAPVNQPAQVYRGSSMPAGSVWPVYPNYGNPVGSAYSAAAGLRPGQFFGTFGLRPADARARGAY